MGENNTDKLKLTSSNSSEPALTASEEKHQTASDAKQSLSIALHVLRGYVNTERVIGLITLLLVPCFLAAWVSLPVAEKVGLKFELSVPSALSAGTSVVNTLENIDDTMKKFGTFVTKAAEITKKAADVAAIASSSLNETNTDKEALKNAVASLVEVCLSNSDDQTKANVASAQQSASAAKEVAGDAAKKAAHATSSVNEKAQTANDNVTQAISEYEKVLNPIKSVLTFVTATWRIFLLLIAIAGVLLLVGIRGRYVTGIIALAFSLVASLATIIGITLVDQFALDSLMQSAGAWITALIPTIVSVTVWPWIVLIASAVCLVLLSRRLHMVRKQKKALAEELQQTEQLAA